MEQVIKLNDKQIRGVEMVIKAISRKYKFVKGWELYERNEKYESVLFINLIMDYQEFADTYKYYTRRNKHQRITTSSIAAYMSKSEEDFNKPYDEKNTLYDEITNIRNEMEKSIKQLYDNLPEEFISHFYLDSSPDKPHPRTIMISDYIDTHIPN